MLKKLLAFLAFLPSLCFADGISLGAGKLLNNTNKNAPGYLVDVSYRKDPWQVSVTRTNETYLGEEMNVSLFYRKEIQKLSLAAGPVISQTYSVPDWWFGEGKEQAWGLKSQCFLCGFALQVGYQITPKLEMQVRYWGTDRFLIPSHNGALVVFSYSL